MQEGEGAGTGEGEELGHHSKLMVARVEAVDKLNPIKLLFDGFTQNRICDPKQVTQEYMQTNCVGVLVDAEEPPKPTM